MPARAAAAAAPAAVRLLLVTALCLSPSSLVAASAPAEAFQASPAAPGEAGSGSSLLAELPAALGSDGQSQALYVAAEKDLPEFESALQPMLATLSSSEAGRFGPTTVRYALHRLFMRRHGWLVKGLDPEGQAWNSTSPASASLLRGLPRPARSLIQQRLERPGLAQQDVALLAALMENRVHQDATGRLRAVYRVLELPTVGAVDAVSGMHAMETYTAAFVYGHDPTRMNRTELAEDLLSMPQIYPNWVKVRTAVQGLVRREAAGRSLEFAGAAKVVREIGEQFVNWQASECQAMKTSLLALEDRGTGRVRLADFYGKSLHDGKWQLSESLPYLRQLGALDESNPNNLRVIIPNYVNGASNCLAASEHLAVCCISECEAIQGHIERDLAAPEALPQDVAALVTVLPSATVPAQRSLSTVMLHRLRGIASGHDGRVPLHGRLFAQWLHHAYPRECSYPHLSGLTRPLQTEDWARSTGLDYIASPESMAKHAGRRPEAKPKARSSRPLESAPWSNQEELFVPHPERPTLWATLHGVVFVACAALAAFGFLLLRTARAARRAAVAPRAPAGKPCLV